MHYPYKQREKRSASYLLELGLATIYQLIMVVLLAVHYGKDETLCDYKEIDRYQSLGSGMTLSQWILVQIIIDVFCIVRILTLILVFKNAENPKQCEVALYLV